MRVKQSHSDMKYKYQPITPVVSARKITQTAQGMIGKMDRSRSNVIKTSQRTRILGSMMMTDGSGPIQE